LPPLSQQAPPVPDKTLRNIQQLPLNQPLHPSRQPLQPHSFQLYETRVLIIPPPLGLFHEGCCTNVHEPCCRKQEVDPICCHRHPEIGSIAATACPFGLETSGRQPITQHVGAITLDLDDPVDHGTAATAAGLDPFGQRLELIGGQRQPADGGHRLAAAALGLPAYPGDPVTSRKLWLTADAGILRLSAIGTHASAVSGVHQSTQGSETGLSLGHELNPAPAVDAGRSARRWPGTDSWP